MRKTRFLLAAVIGALVLAAGAVEVDGIAAKVNADTILKSDVYLEMRRRGLDESQYADVCAEMVDRRLILKAAEDAKMSIQDWVVENRVDEIVGRNFGGDRNQLVDMLARQRQSYDEWRRRLREDMVVSAMRWQVVDKNVSASPAELRLEYDRHPLRYSIGRRTTVSIILLKPEDADKRAAVSAELKIRPFATVAKKYSADAKAAEGGVWRDVDPSEQFRPEICEAIGKMACGDMSEWIDLDGWSFLLRKDSVSEAKRLSFVEAYDEIAANVKEEQAKRLYRAWLDRLRAASFVKVY